MSKHLISEQSYTIYLDYASNVPKKIIAAKIGVHPSTVTREIKRNANRDGTYHYVVANKRCEERKRNTLGNHRKDPILWWRVEQMIVEDNWSPRQISGVLAGEGIRICPQTIYNHIHADGTGEVGEILAASFEIPLTDAETDGDQGAEHPPPHEHPRASGRGGRTAIRGL